MAGRHRAHEDRLGNLHDAETGRFIPKGARTQRYAIGLDPSLGIGKKGKKTKTSRETANRGEILWWLKTGKGLQPKSRHKGGRKSTTGFNRTAFDRKLGKAITVPRLKQFW